MNTNEVLYVNSGLTETPVVVTSIPNYVRSYAAFNAGSSGVYLHLMNASTTGAAVAGAIIATIFVPAGGGANLSGLQWGFTTGIAIAASSSASSISAPANSIVVNLGRG